MMVVTVNRNAALREVKKRPGTSEIKTKPLLQIREEMEANIRAAAGFLTADRTRKKADVAGDEL